MPVIRQQLSTVAEHKQNGEHKWAANRGARCAPYNCAASPQAKNTERPTESERAAKNAERE
jgi:hypothetical protein